MTYNLSRLNQIYTKLAANGLTLLLKIRFVAVTLLDSISVTGNESEEVVRDRTNLMHFLSILSDIENVSGGERTVVLTFLVVRQLKQV